jgi:pimeloyl-ACP methyl ester carboxylesterase
MKNIFHLILTSVFFLGSYVNLMASETQRSITSFDPDKRDEALEFKGDLPVYKWIELKSYPNIKIPIYKSSGSNGPSVLFIHGNSSSSRAFHKQINSDFGRNYKLFFLDLPGHGLASKVDPKKTMPLLENSEMPAGFKEYQDGVPEAVKLVANDPEIQAKIVVGWSLGGHVAIKAQSLGYLPLVKGIFIYGTAPATRYSPIKVPSFKSYGVLDYAIGMPLLPSLGLSFKLSTNAPYFRLDSKFTDRLPWYTPSQFSYYPSRGFIYLKSFFNPNTNYGFGQRIPEFVMQDGFERSDDRFRTSLAVMALELDEKRKDQPTDLDILKKLAQEKITLGVALGDNDMFINKYYLDALKNNGYLKTLWKNEIKIIKDSGHASQLEQPEVFNSMIEDFIKDNLD